MATFADLAGIVDTSHAALDAFVRGDPEPLKALYSHGDDVTIANPFGPPERGWLAAAEHMTRSATNFRDGTALGFDRVSDYTTSELAYILEIERYRTKVGGREEPTTVTLRVTTVFRPEEGRWRIVHRHADPITTPRGPDSIVQG